MEAVGEAVTARDWAASASRLGIRCGGGLEDARRAREDVLARLERFRDAVVVL